MKAIELFAGAGGAALGLEAAGVEHLALCEWDADACATLRAAGLGPVVEGDVRDLDAIARVAGESCDLLWSSFPCQAFSTAGKRLGAKDERNGWPWTVDALDRFQPAWFLGENVRGLLNHRGGCVYAGGQTGMFGANPAQDCPGCYFERVILRDLRERFDHVGWWLLDAADYGVPQHRRRVILWAGPSPVEQPAPTHGPGMPGAWVSMGEALGLTVGRVVAAGETGAGRPRTLGRSAPAIGTGGTAYLVGSGLKGSEWGVERPAPTLRNGNGTAGLYLRRPSPTITVADGQGLGSSASRDAVERRLGRRRLTIQECAILQDFLPDHPWQGTKAAQYRQVGNAVPPTLAQVCARAVMRANRQVFLDGSNPDPFPVEHPPCKEHTMTVTDNPPPYRPRLSNQLEAAVKAAAALAGLSVPDYWQRVVLPLVQSDLHARTEALGMGEDATVPVPAARTKGADDAQ